MRLDEQMGSTLVAEQQGASCGDGHYESGRREIVNRATAALRPTPGRVHVKPPRRTDTGSRTKPLWWKTSSLDPAAAPVQGRHISSQARHGGSA